MTRVANRGQSASRLCAHVTLRSWRGAARLACLRHLENLTSLNGRWQVRCALALLLHIAGPISFPCSCCQGFQACVQSSLTRCVWAQIEHHEFQLHRSVRVQQWKSCDLLRKRAVKSQAQCLPTLQNMRLAVLLRAYTLQMASDGHRSASWVLLALRSWQRCFAL